MSITNKSNKFFNYIAIDPVRNISKIWRSFLLKFGEIWIQSWNQLICMTLILWMSYQQNQCVQYASLPWKIQYKIQIVDIVSALYVLKTLKNMQAKSKFYFFHYWKCDTMHVMGILTIQGYTKIEVWLYCILFFTKYSGIVKKAETKTLHFISNDTLKF